MGTFTRYYGEITIPEEKRAEFAKNMLTLLYEGGMMDLEAVTLYGKTIELLCPPDPQQQTPFCACYNYFENDTWEYIAFDPQTCRFNSNKVGSRDFMVVTHAAWLLHEFYSETPVIAEVDGYILASAQIIGWFNHLFGTQFTNERATDIWKIYRLTDRNDYQSTRYLAKLSGELPLSCANQRSVFLYRFVEDPAGTIAAYRAYAEKAGNQNLSDLPNILQDMTDAIQSIALDDNGMSKEDKLTHLVQVIRNRVPVSDLSNDPLGTGLRTVMQLEPRLSSEITACIIANAFDGNIWDILRELETAYRFGDFFTEPCVPCLPEEPRKTWQILNCSSTDQIYFWPPDSNISFSKSMDIMVDLMKKGIGDIAGREGSLLTEQEFPQRLIAALDDARNTYGNIFAFRSMFYEFLSRSGERTFQAAVLYLERIVRSLVEEADRKTGAVYLRSYLALLANKPLREMKLGF